MYQLFFNNKQVVLTTEFLPEGIEFTSPSSLIEKIKLFLDSDAAKIIFYFNDLKLLFESLKSQTKYIEAAGGLVYNPKNQLLLIYRNNKWDLPKGKIEKRESPREAAVREVEEECGLLQNVLTITDILPNTYHLYYHKNKLYLKKTFWFKMTYNQQTELVPQLEEQITKAIWANLAEIMVAKENTHDSLLQLFEYAIQNK